VVLIFPPCNKWKKKGKEISSWSWYGEHPIRPRPHEGAGLTCVNLGLINHSPAQPLIISNRLAVLIVGFTSSEAAYLRLEAPAVSRTPERRSKTGHFRRRGPATVPCEAWHSTELFPIRSSPSLSVSPGPSDGDRAGLVGRCHPSQWRPDQLLARCDLDAPPTQS
jgi:hypothetical protein